MIWTLNTIVSANLRRVSLGISANAKLTEVARYEAIFVSDRYRLYGFAARKPYCRKCGWSALKLNKVS
jgi:hypothetical protein